MCQFLRQEEQLKRMFFQLPAAYSQFTASDGIMLHRMQQMDAATIAKTSWCHIAQIWQHGTKDQQTLKSLEQRFETTAHTCPVHS